MNQFDDIKLAEKKYLDLINSVQTKLPDADKQLIRKAYEFVLDVYHDKKMESGVLHSLNVAIIVVKQMGLGTTSIISALLHNIVRKSDISLPVIRKEFGNSVAEIIEGLNKIANLSTERTSMNAENFIKLLLTLSPDVRVILLKLADRLDYMYNFNNISDINKQRISEETSHLYIPIAHRLGLYNIKTELEELSMKYSHPVIYKDITNRIKETKAAREIFITELLKPIETELNTHKINYEIKGRVKSIASIWNKMKNQEVDFEEVYDLFAIRIIETSLISGKLSEKQFKELERSNCWRIYSIVTNIYQPFPKRLRDWITTPKASGYESLHTTVMAPGGKWVEVQIRTIRMDEIAEKGGAAHWKYKKSAFKDNSDQWLAKMREKLENPAANTPKSPVNAKGGLYSNDIFVFTPKGDIKKLSSGSTVLDFAYTIHSNIGNTCTGARVNNKIVQLKYELKNGDQVEIMTSKTQKPKLDWLKIVKSTKAKAKIKRTVIELKYKDSEIGKEILKRKLSQLKLSFNNQNINKLVKHFDVNIPLELYQNLAEGKIDVLDIKNCFFSTKDEEGATIDPNPQSQTEETTDRLLSGRSQDMLLINGSSDLKEYSFAKCCKPVYGDQIFGFITVGKGIRIHRSNCPNAKQMKSYYKYRIIDAKWIASSQEGPFKVELKIFGKDELGIINNISHLITEVLRIKMDQFSFSTKKDQFEGNVNMYVKDSGQLDYVVSKILKINGVKKVSRIK